MKPQIKTVLQRKQEGRAVLAQLSFSEKIALLEKLRERNRLITASRRKS
jgi:hypothetical protein